MSAFYDLHFLRRREEEDIDVYTECRFCGEKRSGMLHYCEGVREQTERIQEAARKAREEQENRIKNAVSVLRELGVPMEREHLIATHVSLDVEKLAAYLSDERQSKTDAL